MKQKSLGQRVCATSKILQNGWQKN